MMASSVVKEVGTKVAQFMGYNKLKPEQVATNVIIGILSKHNIFGILPLDLASPLTKFILYFAYGRFCDLIQVPTRDPE